VGPQLAFELREGEIPMRFFGVLAQWPAIFRYSVKYVQGAIIWMQSNIECEG
jgi:hypothetical protein